MYSQGNNPFKKRMGEFQHSDAPDAKGKLARSIASLNQQIVFNRKKNPSYAAKMRKTQDIVRKRFGKKKK